MYDWIQGRERRCHGQARPGTLGEGVREPGVVAGELLKIRHDRGAVARPHQPVCTERIDRNDEEIGR